MKQQEKRIIRKAKMHIALFLIFLILSLPIYTASAFAAVPASIQIPAYQGEDQIPRFRSAENDVLHVEVPIKINGTDESELSTKLFLQNGFGGKVPFTACSHVSGYDYVCTLDDPSDYPAGKFTDAYEIKLTDKSCIMGDSLCKRKLSPLFVDNTPPSVVFTASITPTAGPLLISQLSVKDVLCKGGELCKDSCSGIQTVQVSAASGETLFSKTFSEVYPQQKCEYKPPFVELDVSSLPEGKNTICASAADQLGNSNTETESCQDIFINKQIPSVDLFEMYDVLGNVLNQAGSFMTEKGLQIQFKITASSALAQVKEITLTVFRSTGAFTQTAVCGESSCIFTSNLISLTPQDNPAKYELTITDTTGLSANQAGEISFLVDDKAPEITAINSLYQFQENAYLTEYDNAITVSYTGEEAGIGLEKMILFVGDTQYVTSEEDIPPCSATECVFYVHLSAQQKDKKEIILRAKGIDKLGHEGKEEAKTFLIDTNQKPTINWVQIQDVAPQGVVNPFFTAGDLAIITVNVTDNTGMLDAEGNFHVYANFSKLTGVEELVKADACVSDEAGEIETDSSTENEASKNTASSSSLKQGKPALCTFALQSPLISLKNQEKASITFSLSDFTGAFVSPLDPVNTFHILWSDESGAHILKGTNEKGESIIVREKLGEKEKGDFWDISAVRQSPDFVDRQLLGGTLEVPVTFLLDVKPKNAGTTKIEKVSLLKCNDYNESTSADYSSYFVTAKTRLLQEGFLGKDNPNPSRFLQFYLAPGITSADVQLLNIQCTFKTIGTVNKKITEPEEDVVLFSVKLYNNPLGEIAQEQRKEIEDFQDGAWAKMNDVLSILEEIFIFLEKLCKLVDILNKLNMLVSGLKDFFDVLCDTGVGSAFCGPATAMGKISDATGKTTEQLWGSKLLSYSGKVGRIACGMVSCQAGAFQTLYDSADDAQESLGKFGSAMHTYDTSVSTAQSYMADLGASTNPKDSIIMSIAKLCLPGIIYNLKKLQTIECTYITCLKDTANKPAVVCQQQKGFAQCKFWLGEFWQWFPLTTVFAKITEFVKPFVQGDAVGIVSLIAGSACNIFCTSPGTGGCFLCNTLRYGNLISEVICDIGIPNWFGSDKCPGFFTATYWNDGWSDKEACDLAIVPLPEVKKADATPTEQAALG